MKGEREREEDHVACSHEHDRTPRIKFAADFPESDVLLIQAGMGIKGIGVRDILVICT